MKNVIKILTFLILTGCGQPTSEQNADSVSDTLSAANSDTISTNKVISVPQNLTEEKQNEENYRRQSLSRFEKATLYKLTDTITADFNGDGDLDKAYYIKDNGTSGIIIIHGKTNEEVKIGFGERFAHLTDFDWIGYWGLVDDRETYENTEIGSGDLVSKEVKLENPSIALGSDDSVSGLITFVNGKYVWIHQTC